jgi:oxygen-dependent protoporphyrinogen oxidase
MEREHRSIIRALRKNSKLASKAGAKGAVSGARYGLFISLRGGLQRLVDRLVEVLGDGDLNLETPVTSVVRDIGGGYLITLGTTEELKADAVVLALPAGRAAKLCRDLDPELAGELAKICYADVATINLGFDRDKAGSVPNAAGFVVPAVEKRRILACTFASTKYLDRSEQGGVLLRAFVGGAMNEKQLELEDDVLVEHALEDLRRWIPGLQEPNWSSVHRWPKAMAQPHVGHQQLLERIRRGESRNLGLALVGNGYEGVGISDVISQADKAAVKALECFDSAGRAQPTSPQGLSDAISISASA